MESEPMRRPGFERSLCKKIIRRQMNQSGNTLVGAMELLTDEQFFSAGLNGVSPAWTLGHLACVIDLFDSWLRGMMPALPGEVHQVFNRLEIGPGGASKASSVLEAGYDKAALILLFRQAQVRALETLDAFDEQRWFDPMPCYVPENLGTYGAVWEALGVHTYWHLGELSGTMPQFHGTYSLNSVLHYFYVPPTPAEEEHAP